MGQKEIEVSSKWHNTQRRRINRGDAGNEGSMPSTSTKEKFMTNKYEKLNDIYKNLARVESKYVGKSKDGKPDIEDILSLANSIRELTQIVGKLNTEHNDHKLHNMIFR